MAPAAALAMLAWSASAGAVSLYATNQSGTGSVAAFTIGATGALTSESCTTCSTAQSPYGIAISPSDSELFTSDQVGGPASGALSPFAVGAGGALSAVDCSPSSDCQTGTGTAPFAIAVDPTAPYVYTASENGAGGVFGFAIGASGALSPLPCGVSNCQTGASPAGIAINPSGTLLYTTNQSSNSISAFAIGTGGTLTALSATAGVNSPLGIAIDPTGTYLYATSSTPPGGVVVFTIGAGGALTRVICGTGCQTGGGSQPFDLVVDPTGRYVYAADAANNRVDAFAIGAGGALTPIPCASACGTPFGPKTLAIDPTGHFLYVGYENSTISPFSIGSDGSLTPVHCPDCQTTGLSYGLAVAPDPGPTAGLLTSPAPAGTATTLSASGSSSPAYPIATYTWSFGDGTSATTASPTTAHAYSAAGSYQASVTVTDQAGCSTAVIFTGQSPYCDGSSKATATNMVTIAGPLTEPPPSILAITGARESHRFWREGRTFAQITRVRRAAPLGTSFSFDLNENARVTFTFALAKPGRTVGRRCVAPRTTNVSRRVCKRYVRQAAISFTAHPGANVVSFQGRLRRKRWLTPGNYALTIGASARGRQHAPPVRLSFTVIR